MAGGNGAGINDKQLWNSEGVAYDEITADLIIANAGGRTLVRWKRGTKNGTLIAGVPGVAGNNVSMVS